jgi:hypothetical protein
MSHGQNLSSTSGEPKFVAQVFEIPASGLRSKDLPQVKYICVKGLKIPPLVLRLDWAFQRHVLLEKQFLWLNSFRLVTVDWYYFDIAPGIIIESVGGIEKGRAASKSPL